MGCFSDTETANAGRAIKKPDPLPKRTPVGKVAEVIRMSSYGYVDYGDYEIITIVKSPESTDTWPSLNKNGAAVSREENNTGNEILHA